MTGSRRTRWIFINKAAITTLDSIKLDKSKEGSNTAKKKLELIGTGF